jgi:hypothetical protein
MFTPLAIAAHVANQQSLKLHHALAMALRFQLTFMPLAHD